MEFFLSNKIPQSSNNHFSSNTDTTFAPSLRIIHHNNWAGSKMIFRPDFSHLVLVPSWQHILNVSTSTWISAKSQKIPDSHSITHYGKYHNGLLPLLERRRSQCAMRTVLRFQYPTVIVHMLPEATSCLSWFRQGRPCPILVLSEYKRLWSTLIEPFDDHHDCEPSRHWAMSLNNASHRTGVWNQIHSTQWWLYQHDRRLVSRWYLGLNFLIIPPWKAIRYLWTLPSNVNADCQPHITLLMKGEPVYIQSISFDIFRSAPSRDHQSYSFQVHGRSSFIGNVLEARIASEGGR